MPDFDPKSIPVLDDVIENDLDNHDSAEEEDQTVVLVNPQSDKLNEENFDLFTGEEEVLPEASFGNDVLVNNVLSSDMLDDSSDTTPQFTAFETEVEDSEFYNKQPIIANPDDNSLEHYDVLIEGNLDNIREDSGEEAGDDAWSDIREDTDDSKAQTSEVHIPENQVVETQVAEPQVVETQVPETLEPVVAIEPIALQAMAENIVNQLLPGLEQQLQTLVMQALEEKIPEEFILKDENTQ